MNVNWYLVFHVGVVWQFSGKDDVEMEVLLDWEIPESKGVG